MNKTPMTKTEQMALVVEFTLAATDRRDSAAIALGLAAKAEIESDEPFCIALPRVLRGGR